MCLKFSIGTIWILQMFFTEENPNDTKIIQPANFRHVYLTCEVSCGPHSEVLWLRGPPGHVISKLWCQQDISATWVNVGQAGSFLVFLNLMHLCTFLFCENCGFYLHSPKKQMLRHCSVDALLLPSGLDGLKAAEGWRTLIFRLTGRLPPATILYS